MPSLLFPRDDRESDSGIFFYHSHLLGMVIEHKGSMPNTATAEVQGDRAGAVGVHGIGTRECFLPTLAPEAKRVAGKHQVPLSVKCQYTYVSKGHKRTR